MKKYIYRNNCYSLENVRKISLLGSEISILYEDGYVETLKLGSTTEAMRYIIFEEICKNA